MKLNEKDASANANGADSNVDSAFMGIVSWSTALCLGGVLASLQALYKDGSGFGFHVTFATVAAFLVGVVAGLLYWRAARRGRSIRRVSIAVLVLFGAMAFLYPIRFLTSDNRVEMLRGFAAAAIALSLGAFILWRLARFFERDASKTAGDNGDS
jgi:hypothetical protein